MPTWHVHLKTGKTREVSNPQRESCNCEALVTPTANLQKHGKCPFLFHTRYLKRNRHMDECRGSNDKKHTEFKNSILQVNIEEITAQLGF